jgi:hypothetical protein
MARRAERPIFRMAVRAKVVGDRMTRLGSVMREAIVHHYSRDEAVAGRRS